MRVAETVLVKVAMASVMTLAAMLSVMSSGSIP